MAWSIHNGVGKNGMPLAVRAFAVWLLLITAEVAHGIVRALVLTPVVGDFRARQLGVFTGSLLILLITALTIRWIGANRLRMLLTIGSLWVALTVSFEISLGRMLGYSWERLASDYNMLEGGLLPIGFVIMATAPLIAVRLKTHRLSARKGALRRASGFQLPMTPLPIVDLRGSVGLVPSLADRSRCGRSYDCSVLAVQRGALSVVTRLIAFGCAVASATLAVYSAMLVYAAATFEHDSLPGPAVLGMVAVGVGLVAILCGGVSRVLWRVSKRPEDPARPTAASGR